MPLRTAPPTRWFHRHPAATLIAIVVVGMVAVLTAAELVTRLVAPGWAPKTAERVVFWRYDPLLGWAHEPGQHGRFTHPDFTVDVAISSQGLRDEVYPYERTDKHRMLVLGDSFAWGFGVQHDECFSEILEREHVDWEVIDAGVSGYGTDQELLYFRDQGVRFQPDVVLLLFHENDLYGNTIAEAYWYSKPYFVLDDGTLELRNTPVPKTTIKQRCNRLFYGRTYLLSRLWATLGQLTRELRRPFWSKSWTPESGSAWQLTGALIASLNESCTDAGARLVIASVPTEESPRDSLARVCEREKIAYLPLDDAFAAAGGGLTFAHDGHWTPKGHRAAAAAIDAFLDERGVWAAAARPVGESPQERRSDLR